MYLIDCLRECKTCKNLSECSTCISEERLLDSFCKCPIGKYDDFTNDQC